MISDLFENQQFPSTVTPEVLFVLNYADLEACWKASLSRPSYFHFDYLRSPDKVVFLDSHHQVVFLLFASSWLHRSQRLCASCPSPICRLLPYQDRSFSSTLLRFLWSSEGLCQMPKGEFSLSVCFCASYVHLISTTQSHRSSF
jgi:hypothetical protein